MASSGSGGNGGVEIGKGYIEVYLKLPDLNEASAEIAKALGGSIDTSQIAAAAQKIQSAMSGAGAAAAKAGAELDQTASKFASAMESLGSETAQLVGETGKAASQMTAFESALESLTVSTARLKATEEEEWGVLVREGQARSQAAAAAKKLADAENAGAAAARRMLEEETGAAAATKRAAMTFDQLNEEIRQTRADAKALESAWRNGTITLGTYEAGLRKLQSRQAALTGGFRQLSGGSANWSQVMIQAGYAVDDLQYGFAGIANNIQPLLGSIPGIGAWAAGISIAGIGVYQLYTHWDDLMGLFQEKTPVPALEGLAGLEEQAKNTGAELDELRKKQSLTADELGRYNQLLATQAEIQGRITEERAKQDAFDRLKKIEPEGAGERKKALETAIAQTPGGLGEAQKAVAEGLATKAGMDLSKIDQETRQAFYDAAKEMLITLERTGSEQFAKGIEDATRASTSAFGANFAFRLHEKENRAWDKNRKDQQKEERDRLDKIDKERQKKNEEVTALEDEYAAMASGFEQEARQAEQKKHDEDVQARVKALGPQIPKQLQGAMRRHQLMGQTPAESDASLLGQLVNHDKLAGIPENLRGDVAKSILGSARGEFSVMSDLKGWRQGRRTGPIVSPEDAGVLAKGGAEKLFGSDLVSRITAGSLPGMLGSLASKAAGAFDPKSLESKFDRLIEATQETTKAVKDGKGIMGGFGP